MNNVIAAVLFCLIAFATGLSFGFNIIPKFADENKLFSSLKNSVLTYTIGITMASVFAVISFVCVCRFQDLMH